MTLLSFRRKGNDATSRKKPWSSNPSALSYRTTTKQNHNSAETEKREKTPSLPFIRTQPAPYQYTDEEDGEHDAADDSSLDMSLYTTRSKATVQYNNDKQHQNDYDYWNHNVSDFSNDIALARFSMLGGRPDASQRSSRSTATPPVKLSLPAVITPTHANSSSALNKSQSLSPNVSRSNSRRTTSTSTTTTMSAGYSPSRFGKSASMDEVDDKHLMSATARITSILAGTSIPRETSPFLNSSARRSPRKTQSYSPLIRNSSNSGSGRNSTRVFNKQGDDADILLPTLGHRQTSSPNSVIATVTNEGTAVDKKKLGTNSTPKNSAPSNVFRDPVFRAKALPSLPSPATSHTFADSTSSYNGSTAESRRVDIPAYVGSNENDNDDHSTSMDTYGYSVHTNSIPRVVVDASKLTDYASMHSRSVAGGPPTVVMPASNGMEYDDYSISTRGQSIASTSLRPSPEAYVNIDDKKSSSIHRRIVPVTAAVTTHSSDPKVDIPPAVVVSKSYDNDDDDHHSTSMDTYGYSVHANSIPRAVVDALGPDQLTDYAMVSSMHSRGGGPPTVLIPNGVEDDYSISTHGQSIASSRLGGPEAYNAADKDKSSMRTASTVNETTNSSRSYGNSLSGRSVPVAPPSEAAAAEPETKDDRPASQHSARIVSPSSTHDSTSTSLRPSSPEEDGTVDDVDYKDKSSSSCKMTTAPTTVNKATLSPRSPGFSRSGRKVGVSCRPTKSGDRSFSQHSAKIVSPPRLHSTASPARNRGIRDASVSSHSKITEPAVNNLSTINTPVTTPPVVESKGSRDESVSSHSKISEASIKNIPTINTPAASPRVLESKGSRDGSASAHSKFTEPTKNLSTINTPTATPRVVEMTVKPTAIAEDDRSRSAETQDFSISSQSINSTMTFPVEAESVSHKTFDASMTSTPTDEEHSVSGDTYGFSVAPSSHQERSRNKFGGPVDLDVPSSKAPSRPVKSHGIYAAPSQKLPMYSEPVRQYGSQRTRTSDVSTTHSRSAHSASESRRSRSYRDPDGKVLSTSDDYSISGDTYGFSVADSRKPNRTNPPVPSMLYASSAAAPMQRPNDFPVDVDAWIGPSEPETEVMFSGEDTKVDLDDLHSDAQQLRYTFDDEPSNHGKYSFDEALSCESYGHVTEDYNYSFEKPVDLDRKPTPDRNNLRSSSFELPTDLGMGGEELRVRQTSSFEDPVDLDRNKEKRGMIRRQETLQQRSQNVRASDQDMQRFFCPPVGKRRGKYTGPVDLDESVADSVSEASFASSQPSVTWQTPTSRAALARRQRIATVHSGEESAMTAPPQRMTSRDASSVVPLFPSDRVSDETVAGTISSDTYGYNFQPHDDNEEGVADQGRSDDSTIDTYGFSMHRGMVMEPDREANDDVSVDNSVDTYGFSVHQGQNGRYTRNALRTSRQTRIKPMSIAENSVLLTEGELQRHSSHQNSEPLPPTEIQGYDQWRQSKEREKRYFGKAQGKVETKSKQRGQQKSPPSAQPFPSKARRSKSSDVDDSPTESAPMSSPVHVKKGWSFFGKLNSKKDTKGQTKKDVVKRRGSSPKKGSRHSGASEVMSLSQFMTLATDDSSNDLKPKAHKISENDRKKQRKAEILRQREQQAHGKRIQRRRKLNNKSSGVAEKMSRKEGLETTATLPKCVLCKSSDRTHIAMPCMHFYFCEKCSSAIAKTPCPTCPVCCTRSVTFSKVLTG